MLCALQHVSEKQEKSKDRLVKDLKKKKSSTETEEDTQQRHLGIRAQEENPVLKNKNRKQR